MKRTPRPFASVLLAGWLSSCLWAAAPPTPDVGRLVRQLGSDSFAERQAATRELDRAGEAALPALRELLRTNPDLEAQRRARRLVRGIERRSYGEVRDFAAGSGSVNCVAFTADGRRGLSGNSPAVRLWDLATGKELRRLEEHGDRVMAVAVSRDGKVVASGSEDRTVRLWDLSRGEELHCLKGHKDSVRGVAISADGRRVLSGGLDGTVRLWDTSKGGRQVHCFRLPGVRVFAVALSPDGRFALSGGSDRTPRLWDLEKGREVRPFSGHTRLVMGLAFSPDGKRALSAGHDATVRLWPELYVLVPLESTYQAAFDLVPRRWRDELATPTGGGAGQP